MNNDQGIFPLEQRLEHLFRVISSKRFLDKQGLGNEIPFFICPYRPEEAVEMDRIRRQLINRLNQNGIRVLEINLYDLTIELLKSRDLWDQVLTMEEDIPKDELLENLQGVLDSEAHLVPAIASRISQSEFEVMIISGVGEVFPYIRSHNVLNNLQSKAKEKPTVMFFPGVYTHSQGNGSSLDLFGRLCDDKYYRAFNIYYYEA